MSMLKKAYRQTCIQWRCHFLLWQVDNIYLWYPTSVMPYNVVYVSFIYDIANDPEGRDSYRWIPHSNQESREGFYSGEVIAPFSDVFAASNSRLSAEWTLILPIFSSSTSTKFNRSCHQYIHVHLFKATNVLWIYRKALCELGRSISTGCWININVAACTEIHTPMYNVQFSLSCSLRVGGVW